MKLGRASLRRRLPAWIALVLIIAVISFGALAYRAVRRSDLDAAWGRLRTVADRLAQMTRGSITDRLRRMREVASDPALVDALEGSRDAVDRARTALARIGPDTGTAITTLLQDRSGRTVVALDREVPAILAERGDSAAVSPLVARGDSILLEYSAPVVARRRVIGHLVQLRRVRAANPQALRAVSELVGTGARIFVMNRDGSLWTDFNSVIESPAPLGKEMRYQRNGEQRLMASEAIGGTPLVWVVEFSESRVLAKSRLFLLQLGVIAVVVIGLGVTLVWLLTRRITRPLADLTTAAELITAGGTPVGDGPIDRPDEIGRLAQAFHQMAESVRQSRENLEHQVAERTSALERAQHALVQKERMAVLGQLASTVGHELRNPLGVMNNVVYYLKATLRDESGKVTHHLGILGEQIKLAEKIVADVLDFTRVQAPEIAEVEIDRFIDDQLRRVTVPPGITLHRDVPPDLPPMRVDRRQVGQVFFNVLTNAIQAIDGKDGVVRVRCRALNGRVRLEVEDNGPGVAPEHRERIFEPLFTTKTRGFGLGLSVSRSLALANAGDLTVSNGPSGGAVFVLELPAGTTA